MPLTWSKRPPGDNQMRGKSPKDARVRWPLFGSTLVAGARLHGARPLATAPPERLVCRTKDAEKPLPLHRRASVRARATERALRKKGVPAAFVVAPEITLFDWTRLSLRQHRGSSHQIFLINPEPPTVHWTPSIEQTFLTPCWDLLDTLLFSFSRYKRPKVFFTRYKFEIKYIALQNLILLQYSHFIFIL